MDRASQVLADGLPGSQPCTYRALARHCEVAYATVWHRAHGRRSKEDKAKCQQYLTPAEEKALPQYLKRMADLGYPIPIKHLRSLAFSIARGRSGADVATKPPGKNWPKAFEKRHFEDLKARKVKAVDWSRHDNNIHGKVTHWFEVIREVLEDPDVLRENVYNMDETGIMLCMLGSVKVLVGKNDLRNYRGAGVKRTMVTAIECISCDGKSLLPLIIWPASTYRSNWTTYPTPGWHFACSESGYTDSKISLEWLTRVFDPQTKERAGQKPRVLICDGFGTHETLEILRFGLENNIRLCRLASHTSHKLQPCDVGVFGPLKGAYRDLAERFYRGGANTVGKEHFTALYSAAREKTLTPHNIRAGWGRSGMYPFNPDRVLREIRKPPAELTVPKADDVEAPLCSQDEALQTPATADAFRSLLGLIERDIHALDDEGKLRLKKLLNAAQISFAERALLENDNQILVKQNDEAKRRRLTKSIVLGKAKVMSYEDLAEARAKRAAKEEASESKGRGGRKWKGPATQEAAAKKTKKVRRSEIEVAEDEIVAAGMEDHCSVLQL